LVNICKKKKKFLAKIESLYTRIRAVGLITCKSVEMLTCKLSLKCNLLLRRGRDAVM